MTAMISAPPRDADDTGPQATGASTPARRSRRGMTIQSKLLLMLFAVSLIAAAVAGAIGYVSGRDSLRRAAISQLITIREMRAAAIEHEFATIQRGVVLDSRNASAVEGATAFIEAFDELQSATVSPAELDALESFYADEFVPALESRSGLDFDPEAFVPSSPAGRYLQAHYTAGRAYDDYDTGLALDDAGDGSEWSRANAEYGPYFAGLVDMLGYEDVLILDRDANVVYSAYKSVDLGVNMTDEPYTRTALTLAFEQAMRNGSLDEVITTDFERYLPSLNVPTAWVVSPLGTPADIVGALAIQIPVDQINAVMTGDGAWEDEGLGASGEVYLAGPDRTMRSVSRLLVDDPDRYESVVVEYGTPPATAQRIVAVGGTVQLQPVDFVGVDEALKGRTGTALAADYTNSESLVAYAPLEIDGLDWVIVAHMDQSEAFGPVTTFTKRIVVSTLAILLGVSLLSLLLAQVFTRPVKRLGGAVRDVAAGNLDVEVPAGTRDEFGQLGAAFNDMAASLRLKEELIQSQRSENERLLLALMPETVAERYRSGEESIVEQHDDVSVVFVELVGFDEYAQTLDNAAEVAQLNVLMRGFDEAAEKVGVDKVRTLRGGYLASVGLVVPRVDNARRAVDFAVHARAAVERFNAQNGSSIGLRAGVDTGSVTSGLVARTNLAYDLWGDAVSIAYRARTVSGEPGIYVSDTVRDRLQSVVTFVEAGTIEMRGATRAIWKVA